MTEDIIQPLVNFEDKGRPHRAVSILIRQKVAQSGRTVLGRRQHEE